MVLSEGGFGLEGTLLLVLSETVAVEPDLLDAVVFII